MTSPKPTNTAQKAIYRQDQSSSAKTGVCPPLNRTEEMRFVDNFDSGVKRRKSLLFLQRK